MVNDKYKLKYPHNQLFVNGWILTNDNINNKTFRKVVDINKNILDKLERADKVFILIDKKTDQVRFLTNQHPTLAENYGIVDGIRYNDISLSTIHLASTYDIKLPSIGQLWSTYTPEPESNEKISVFAGQKFNWRFQGDKKLDNEIRVEIKQIWFDQKSNKNLEVCYTPYHNTSKSPIMENRVISEILKQNNDSYDLIGIWSHMFRNKTGLSVSHIIKRLEEKWYRYNPEKNVFAVWKYEGVNDILIKSSAWHPLFTDIWRLIIKRLELDPNLISSKMKECYMNYWLLHPKLGYNYVEFLDKVIEVISNPDDKEMQMMIKSDSTYFKKNHYTKDFLISMFGKPYYTYEPFILERCFSVWCYLNNIDMIHIH